MGQTQCCSVKHSQDTEDIYEKRPKKYVEKKKKKKSNDHKHDKKGNVDGTYNTTNTDSYDSVTDSHTTTISKKKNSAASTDSEPTTRGTSYALSSTASLSTLTATNLTKESNNKDTRIHGIPLSKTNVISIEMKSKDKIGLEITEVSPKTFFITNTLTDGVATDAKIKNGAQILAVDGVAVSSAKSLETSLKSVIECGFGELTVCTGITTEELAKHKSHEDAYVAVSGCVYDMTSFLKSHPGGVSSLMEFAGADATIEFFTVHSNKSYLKKIQHLCVGALIPQYYSALSVINI